MHGVKLIALDKVPILHRKTITLNMSIMLQGKDLRNTTYLCVLGGSVRTHSGIIIVPN